MKQEQPVEPVLVVILVGLCSLLLSTESAAYEQYSQDGDATNCAACHGDFRDSPYTSLVDGQIWADSLHDIHRNDMLADDCNVCHLLVDTFPVVLSESFGGMGLDPAGCTGCHGRDEDNVVGNPSYPNGMSAGLRQHHTAAGVTGCIDCHDDADPASYTPVGENVLPAYYANPGTGHPAIPTGACNDDGSENFDGTPIGLDNDGDYVYDGDDTDCSASGVEIQSPKLARLLQNHPNPLNPQTTIVFELPRQAVVSLYVVDVSGRLVDTLIDSEVVGEGRNEVTWHGRDMAGWPVSAGVYFYRLAAGGQVETRRMVLVK